MSARGNYRKHTSHNPLQRWLIQRFHHRMAGLVATVAGQRILDVGCGEGFTISYLRTRYPRLSVAGVDVDPLALQMAREMNPEVEFSLGDIHALPFADNSFDIILCLEVLEHLQQPDRALVELRRLTSKYAILSVPHEPLFRLANFLRGKNLSTLGDDVEHVFHWSPAIFESFVSRHLSVRRVCLSFPWLIVLAAKE